jgi:biotin synthesis protein BioG
MKLILFFNGWGMKNDVIQHFEKLDEFEVRILNYPYEMEKIEENRYKEIYIIGWSFGVYYATKFIKENPTIKFTKKIAINGVPETIGDYGIPEKIFDMTLKNLSEKTIEEFYQNMELKKNPSIMTNIEDLKEELYFFKKNYLPLENVYDLAIIGINDRIIPSNRQKKYYKKNLVQIRELDAPHYPFKVLNSWKDIID